MSPLPSHLTTTGASEVTTLWHWRNMIMYYDDDVDWYYYYYYYDYYATMT